MLLCLLYYLIFIVILKTAFLYICDLCKAAFISFSISVLILLCFLFIYFFDANSFCISELCLCYWIHLSLFHMHVFMMKTSTTFCTGSIMFPLNWSLDWQFWVLQNTYLHIISSSESDSSHLLINPQIKLVSSAWWMRFSCGLRWSKIKNKKQTKNKPNQKKINLSYTLMNKEYKHYKTIKQ